MNVLTNKEHMYTVHLLTLNKERKEEIKKYDSHPVHLPWYKAYLDAKMFGNTVAYEEAEKYDLYGLKAIIGADNLDEVFMIGNSPSWNNRSISVGDVISTDENEKYVVSVFGFEKVA